MRLTNEETTGKQVDHWCRCKISLTHALQYVKALVHKIVIFPFMVLDFQGSNNVQTVKMVPLAAAAKNMHVAHTYILFTIVNG